MKHQHIDIETDGELIAEKTRKLRKKNDIHLREQMCDENTYKALYDRFRAVKQRTCKKGHPNFYKYGGRGIELKMEREQFIRHCFFDLGFRYPRDTELEIDRIDNDSHYEAGNLRFVGRREQARNKRTNVWIYFRERWMIVADFHAEFIGPQMSRTCVYKRIKNGERPASIVLDAIFKRRVARLAKLPEIEI